MISMEGFSFWELKHEGKLDLFGLLESLAYRYRVRGMGLWNAFFPGQAQRQEVPEEYIQKIRNTANALGLEIPNLHCDNCSVCSNDPEEQEANRKYAMHMLRVGVKLGVKGVRIDWGVRAETLTPRQEERLVNTYREFCAFGEEHGIKVGPENHFGASIHPDLLLRVGREISSPAYGVLLHLGRWAADVSPAQMLEAERAIAPLAMHCHVDLRVDSSISDLSLEDRLRNIREAGYAGWYGVEHAPIGHTHAVNEALLHRLQLALQRLESKGAEEE